MKPAPLVATPTHNISAREIIRTSVQDPHIRLAREENRPVYLHGTRGWVVDTAKKVLGKGFLG